MQQLENLLLSVASLREKYEKYEPPNKDFKVEILIEITAQCIRAGKIPQFFELCTNHTQQIVEVVLELFDVLDDLNIEIGAVFDFKDQTSSTIVFSLVY